MKALAKLARDRYAVGSSLEGRVFVTPTSGPRVSRWLTENSEEIVSDLALYLRNVTGEEFSRTERDNALLSLRDEARAVRPVRTASRIANPRQGVIAVDMCNDAGECYVITKDGWTITTDPGDDVVFIRGENARPLPRAIKGGDLSRIWEIANVPEESRQLIVCNWHTAMQRSADHPIISLVGQAGSAKTSLSAILSYLLDPIEGEGFDSMPIALPEDPAEIYALASSQYFIPFDNVDSMTKQQQTAMSVIATGGIYARRELYTTARIYRAPVRGCLILASIDLGKVKPDFMDRVITVEIEPIPGGVYRDRAEVKAAFDAMHAEVLGGLFDQAVSVLGVYDQVQKNMQQLKIRTSRLSTFSYTLASLDSLYGTSAFPQFMQEQASRQAESATGDALTACVMALIDGQAGKPRTYSPTELLSELEKQRKETDPFARTPMGWPANAQHLTKRIKEMEIPLDRAGYSAAYRRTNKARGWVLARKPVQETAPTTGTVVPINRGTHAPHTSTPAAPEQVAVRTGTDDVDTVTPAATSAAGALSYQCGTQGKHEQCQRNRARGARFAVGCTCRCHDERGDQGDAPTPTEPTSATPTEPTSATPTEPTSATPTEPTSAGAFDRALSDAANTDHGVRDSSALSRRQAGTFTTETAAYVDVAAGKGVTSDDRTFSYRKAKGGPTLARLLGSIPEGVRHVHITGMVPGETPEGFRTWALGALPEGWQVGDRGAMFDARHPDRATLHYVRPDGEPLTIYRAAGWVGIDLEETTGPAELRQAFDLLRAGLRATFTLATRGDHGVPIKATPGATGVELARRTLPTGKTFPILSDADQNTLRSYGGQGRHEDYVLPTHPSGGMESDTIPGLHVYDMRWAYNKALELELPIGVPSKDRESTFLFRDEIERTGFLPCWYRVRVTVPNDWNRRGLFGFRDDSRNGQWVYPSEPGTTFETWAWDRTLLLGEKHGWMIGDHVQILERWKFDAARRTEKPLVTFGKHIRTLRQEWLPAQAATDTVKDLVSAMARNICIAAIGSMQGKRFESYRSESDLSKVAELPETAILSEDGKRYEWFEASSAAGTLAHPEWTAYVYEATRNRLFDHPTQKGVGIAHVDPSVLLAVHTDSLWTTEPIGIEDTGKVGDYRPQTGHDGELPTPRTYAELMAQRNELDQAGA
ncbi:hypothetical protein ACFTWF_44280 [Rhodococcus sp. NPDC056960]|uniref:hypothetical protein n=1 Tax=Rhodococcus sp. NPDC056960 TaxID=3345982 RepID=UPI00362B1966